MDCWWPCGIKIYLLEMRLSSKSCEGIAFHHSALVLRMKQLFVTIGKVLLAFSFVNK